MEIVYNVWLAFNIVFGLWSGRNWLIYFYCGLTGNKFSQSDGGKVLDLLAVVSVLSFLFTFHW